MGKVAGALDRWARFAFLVLALALAGCATRGEAPAARVTRGSAPVVQVSEGTWRQVDRDIAVASVAAREVAGIYAEGEMERWRGRVQEFTETEFIPWFTSYWTQQWLAVKVAWYQLGDGGGLDQATRGLAGYLQGQYRERVLEPVAADVDPVAVREQTTRFYVERLARSLRDLPQRYGVPLDQFDRHLAGIPAIALPRSANRAERRASLLQLVRANPVTRLPAFADLHVGIEKAAAGEGAVPTDARIAPVAKRTSERLVARIAAGGATSVAAAAVGGVAGFAISAVAIGVGAIEHASDEPEMAAQVRESFNAAADEMWRVLHEDADVGVLAGVAHVSAQIEDGVAMAVAQPETGSLPNTVNEEKGAASGGEHYDHDALDRFGTVAE